MSPTPIGRTKLRMVYAVARLKFDMDPIDVGAPVLQAPIPEEKIRLRVEERAALKVKVSSWINPQTSRSKGLPKMSFESSRARFSSLEEEDSMKSEEVTDDQLSVMSALVKAGVVPHTDFWLWRPFGQRTAKNLKLTSHFLDNSGSWRCKEIPGPESYSS